MTKSSSKSARGRSVLLPGDKLADDLKAGSGTFRRDGEAHAAVLGFPNDSSGYVNVHPVAGRYSPRVGDKVIAVCVETGPSLWRMNIGAFQNSMLHHSETDWKVDFGDTASFIGIGDAVLAEVYMVDGSGSHQVTLKKDDCRKLYAGTIVYIPPPRVSRVIGKQGSMIKLLRERTNCRIQVGQNGLVWVDGEPDQIARAQKAIETISREATSSGLTEKIEKLLE
ncbi:MAG: exosome complex protein Rrp4 [Candidatus Thermoplasmatota archaeon]|jgi:exosome complex component RRP4|nr:RNA-binding protein [Euryarchaeota archaeon]MDP6364348.1 exosome complex protein Rrp4 [Candidatus Poseidoniia archaeon]MEC8948394.1 exosome complex protein Rrp4 [Candidatus Thermoplasmatota archaeon]MDP6534056.1 exosome complex protein Rrp4 [Candidatus Poseidoniia archaeon]MDP6835165.1 exosome complex protein Rrp4 [Candidatus Poseidoniia archaeon]